jgi:hypothetical protein
MCFIGADAHRELLVAVAVDEAGNDLGTWSGRNHEQRWTELLIWAEELAGDGARVWGIDGSGNQARRLAQLPVGQGEVVVEIKSRLTAESRNRSRRRDKSDRAGARAITRVLRESWAVRTPARERIYTLTPPTMIPTVSPMPILRATRLIFAQLIIVASVSLDSVTFGPDCKSPNCPRRRDHTT